VTNQFYHGKRALIATMHGKQQVIGPVLQDELGIRVFTLDDFDTDRWGTFSGEVERKSDPLATARQKCLHGLEQGSVDLAVASEGSFGPHPFIPFLAADEEILVFIDRRNDLEIIAKELSPDTNYAASTVTSIDELLAFAETALFPSHALILRPSPDSPENMVKGIRDKETLIKTALQLLNEHQQLHVQTDMRAHMNPTRMQVIAGATRKLAERIKNVCPTCGIPGFGPTEFQKGLPCAQCHFPTKSVQRIINSCLKCSYNEIVEFPTGKRHEDPMYCDNCNP